MADEAYRLGKSGKGIIHRIDLDEVDKEPTELQPIGPQDPIERDLDLLFGSEQRVSKPS